MQNESVAFCETDPTADAIEDMAPRLHETISNCDTWRALILPSLPKNRLNPFQVVACPAVPAIEDRERVDWQALSDALLARAECYRQAVENPLVKLGCALGCARPPIETEVARVHDAFLAGELSLCARMLQKRMEEINVQKSVHWMERYGNSEVRAMVESDEAFAQLLQALRRRDAEAVIDLIGEVHAAAFAEQIAALDSLYADPMYTVFQLDEVSKSRQLQTLKTRFEINDVKPTELLCVAARTCDLSDLRLNAQEDLVRFADYNLYPDNMKFFVFDLLPRSHRQYEQDYIRFLTTVLVLAGYELPEQSVDNGALYQLDGVIHKDRLRRICGVHDAKLSKTKREIMHQISESILAESDPIDNAEARDAFESDMQIRVEISTDFVRNDLLADNSEIGLSGDCPTDEERAWALQFKQISRRFQRYLREPRRSVKTAVRGEFVQKRTLDDERARRLNEFQTEDVLFRLHEEEQNLAETPTVDLFQSDAFTDRLQKAGDALKKHLGCRMTKKLTIGVGTAAGLAFLFGFLPMLFSNLNTAGSFGWSALLAFGSLAILLLTGLVTLFRFRKQTKAQFLAFNNTVNGIHGEILNGLRAFSVYLSHACNVMRIHSTLKAKQGDFSEEVRILRKHVVDIDRKREEIRQLAANNFELDLQAYYDAEPYDYDFKVLKQYEYDPEFFPTADNVEFIEHGTFISVPIDYLAAITVTKEAPNV